MGVGIINFLGAIPAFFTIDRFGRRNLLLAMFPFLALFQLLNAVAFEIGKPWLVIAGLYLFALAYSPGEGPVPFVSTLNSAFLQRSWRSNICQVYSAESMPLYVRDLGTRTLFRPPNLPEGANSRRDGPGHLSPLAFLLYHWLHLALLCESFHFIRSFHVVLRLVHHRSGVDILVRTQPSSGGACPC